MKKKVKKILLILLLVLIVAVICIFVIKNIKNDNKNTENETSKNNNSEEYVNVLDDGTKVNTSEQLKKDKQVGVYKFDNIQITEQENSTILVANVTNTGDSATDVQLVDIKLLDKDGKELGIVGGIIAPLEQGESIQFNSNMTLDYANTYDVEFVLK